MEKEDEDDSIICKVVLIGETFVGKTSIIERYVVNTFTEIKSASSGANFAIKRIKFEEYNQNIKFEIWDTAGMEKYRSLAKIYFKDAAACIFIYDITRKETFNELKQFWVNEIKNSVSSDMSKIIIFNFNIVYAIVGNKSDDYENELVNDTEAKELAKKINAIFQRVSAKKGKGIDELFRLIGKNFLNRELKISNNSTKEEMINYNQHIKIQEIKEMNKEKKKNSC